MKRLLELAIRKAEKFKNPGGYRLCLLEFAIQYLLYVAS